MPEGDSHSAGSRGQGELSRCRICGGVVSPALTAKERMFGLEGEFEYDECRDCGCLQLHTIPEDLSRYYPDAYYTRRAPETSLPVRPANAILRSWSRFGLRSGRLSRILSGRRYARFDWFRRTETGLEDAVLDVGCGSGRLLRRMRRSGFRDLTGIDVNWTGSANPAPGLRFERSSPLDHAGRYHLVMAHHSFEHMRDPAAAFAAMCGLVVPGGALVDTDSGRGQLGEASLRCGLGAARCAPTSSRAHSSNDRIPGAAQRIADRPGRG